MGDYNRISSPMYLVDEVNDLSIQDHQEKINSVKDYQRAQSPFVVGSVQQINKRIEKLGQDLHGYSKLICDFPINASSSFGSISEATLPPSSSFNSKKGRKSPFYRVKDKHDETIFAGVFAVKTTFAFDTSKRVQKIAKIHEEGSTKKKHVEAGAPKFVEMYQFEGYNEVKGNPLPPGANAMQVLRLLSNRLTCKLRKAVGLAYEVIIFSDQSINILQDLFWYFYIERFGSSLDKRSLTPLLTRIAKHYVWMMNSLSPLIKDSFIKNYLQILPQALYACFCHAFPDSYSQLATPEFRNELIRVIYYWFAGITLTLDGWRNWDLELLEPVAVRQREALMKRDDNQNSNNNDSWITKALKEVKSQLPASPSSECSTDSQAVRDVASVNESSIPVREQHFIKGESLPIGPGPQSRRLMFDSTGHSPIINYFLKGHHLMKDTGTSYLLRRTELEPLPTSIINGETYSSMVFAARKRANERLTAFQKKYENDLTTNERFLMEQRRKMLETHAKLDSLLADKREIHRLSNLLVLELQGDPGSLSTVHASQEIEKALLSQT